MDWQKDLDDFFTQRADAKAHQEQQGADARTRRIQFLQQRAFPILHEVGDHIRRTRQKKVEIYDRSSMDPANVCVVVPISDTMTLEYEVSYEIRGGRAMPRVQSKQQMLGSPAVAVPGATLGVERETRDVADIEQDDVRTDFLIRYKWFVEQYDR